MDEHSTMHAIAVLGSACILAAGLLNLLQGLSKSPRVIAIVGIVEGGVLLDRIFNARWLLHSFLVRTATLEHVYPRRFRVQYFAVALVSSAAVGAIGLLLPRLRSQPAALLAASGAVLSLCCWCMEVISLHAVDSLLYHPIDGVLPVQLAWASFALMIGVGVTWDAFSSMPSTPAPAQQRHSSHRGSEAGNG